jgi:hypothetical protein
MPSQTRSGKTLNNDQSAPRRRRGTTSNETKVENTAVAEPVSHIYKRRSKQRHRITVDKPVEVANPFKKRAVVKRKKSQAKKYTVEELDRKVS